MNPLQESKQELNVAIRHAESAISSAKQTMESMNTYQEQTGREQALSEDIDILILENTKLKLEAKDLNFDNTNLQEANDHLEACVADLKARLEESKQALERETAQLHKEVEFYTKKYNELAQGVGTPTMPVIPKAVAIAIFREGVQHGVEAACSEIDNTNDIEINEIGYTGGFEVSFTKYFDLSEHLDTDWMRGKCGDYSEERAIEALGNLCANEKFECRIHGIDAV